MHYDLIIIGGGLVGAGLALALKQSNLKIALVDARMPSNNDPRLFALNHTSCQFLENLNLWSSLQSEAQAIHEVHVSNKGQFGAVRLKHTDVDLPTLGFVIPAYVIETALNSALLTLPNVTLYRPYRLVSLTQDDKAATLIIEHEGKQETLQTNIVIGADGIDSTVRTQLHINTTSFDYQQTAIVTRTTLQRSHQHIAYERFNEHGAIAMLPLKGNECATIWTIDNDQAEELIAASDEAFTARLQKEFGYRVGKMLNISKRHAYPLKMQQAEKGYQGRVLLMGNSLQALHPIAAQGFNLAIYEVAVLVDYIEQHTHLTVDDLHSISEQISKQQAKSVTVSHRLSQLFSSTSPIKCAARQIGMLGLEMATPLKKQFINGIMGRVGRVPSLLLNGWHYESTKTT